VSSRNQPNQRLGSRQSGAMQRWRVLDGEVTNMDSFISRLKSLFSMCPSSRECIANEPSIRSQLGIQPLGDKISVDRFLASGTTSVRVCSQVRLFQRRPNGSVRPPHSSRVLPRAGLVVVLAQNVALGGSAVTSRGWIVVCLSSSSPRARAASC
jgi:hypothetical protein